MQSRTTLRLAPPPSGLVAAPALAPSAATSPAFPARTRRATTRCWGPAYRAGDRFAQPGAPPTPGRSPDVRTAPGRATVSTIGSRATDRTAPLAAARRRLSVAAAPAWRRPRLPLEPGEAEAPLQAEGVLPGGTAMISATALRSR